MGDPGSSFTELRPGLGTASEDRRRTAAAPKMES